MAVAQMRLSGAKIADLKELLPQYEDNNPREAAEIAFAIAIACQQDGDLLEAVRFAKKSIALFEASDTHSEASCAAIRECIAGIQLPGMVHEGVVRYYLLTWGHREA